jgi:iron(III) transport system permease protein
MRAHMKSRVCCTSRALFARALSKPGNTQRWLWVWLALGALGFFVLPWYAVEDGFFSFEWRFDYPLGAAGPAITQGRWWLWPLLLPLFVPLLVAGRPRGDLLRAKVLLWSGGAGLALGLLQGFAFGPLGCTADWLSALLQGACGRQLGLGYGALALHLCFLMVASEGLSARAFSRPDVFVSGSLSVIAAGIGVFVLYPVGIVMLRAFETETGGMSVGVLANNFANARLWSVSFNTLMLAVLAGVGSTALGLVFALAVARSGRRWTKALRMLSVLPIITPPFVIGLALIVTFGRAGAVTEWLKGAFDLTNTRYIYGLSGVLVAQLLSFTPVAFLILVDAVNGVSPSMEEAAQTLRASPRQTFWGVTFPLLRPALANAFLVGFVESLADFGNPLVLGGAKFDVLATEIYFTVAGAQADLPRAAAMGMVLLGFALLAFVAQQRWVGKASYTTVTGKGDAGLPAKLPREVDLTVSTIAALWTLFTLAVYALVLMGGFVKTVGRDHTPTLEHFRALFAFNLDGGLHLTGGAWPSLETTVGLSLVSAPLTAIFGLLTAYLLARQRFTGRAAFEFSTLLSFAIPGTVVGIAYLLAFNAPPFDLIGTGAVLVLCFIFRNMPVGVRSGLAALAQIDASLDEAALTLGASTGTTVRRVVLPLLKPTLVVALVYGFVRAMTAVSAVIFLVSAEHNLSTTYILGQVEGGAYGRAIAYSAVLIVAMLAAIVTVQLTIGRRQIGRRAA